MTMRKPDLSMLAPYIAASYDLIPLHKPDAVSQKGGKPRKDGKRPLDPNWTTRAYEAKAVAKRCTSEGRNVGVRLTAGQLVIDVDPRNFKVGNDSFADLCLDLGLDPTTWPHVVTGSGGDHYYVLKPADVPVLDSLEGYPGVEFKSRGRQVVSAGSVHPETGKLYEFDFLAPELSEAPQVPDNLLNLIRRPQRDAAATGGGQYTQEQVAAMLEGLDPTDFGEHEKWLTLMMACHHASNGDARSEFLDWSARDPKYAGREFENGRRWDSLHSDSGDRVTYRTLNKFLIDAGKQELIPRSAPEDDFKDEDEEEAPTEHKDAVALSPMERMNKEYCAVLDGSKFRIMTERDDPITNRRYWLRLTRKDFEDNLLGRRVESGDTVVQLSKAWLDWGNKRKARGVIFHPNHDHKGSLNLWTGWGVEPKKGSWARMREMIAEVLCDSDVEMNEYVLNLAANMVQRPDQPGEVAACFQGGKGVGKSTFGNALVKIAGRHGLAIHSPGLITGRFNSHLEDVVMLFADEAIKPQDKQAENMLKAIITEPLIMFEGKGRDAKPASNFIHVFMAANEEWIVPASADERRYAVAKVSDKWRGKVAKWEALYAEMKRDDGQGYRAMLFDLLLRDLPKNWNPQAAVPQNAALTDQKLRSMPRVPRWWYEQLYSGRFAFQFSPDPLDWLSERQIAFNQDIRADFAAWAKADGQKSIELERFLFEAIREMCPALDNTTLRKVPEDRPDVEAAADGRAKCCVMPSMRECREAWDKVFGNKEAWPKG